MSSNKVQMELRVGGLEVSMAQLVSADHHLIEFPTLLLPDDVKAGSIVRLTCERSEASEKADGATFAATQNAILETFGRALPSAPVLRMHNTTQTSAVLEWDPISPAKAEILSLSLYKNGQRLGVIPTPLTRTSTKLSNLSIDTKYTFQLVLRTTAGEFRSNELDVHTHKMTDLSGITVCVGSLANSGISPEDLKESIVESIAKIGAKPLQEEVKLDTTHFICTNESGTQVQRAKDLNIPVVRPEWLKACETERRLVGVRQYYLSADPKLMPPTVVRERAASAATTTGTVHNSSRVSTEGGTASPVKASDAPDTAPDGEPDAGPGSVDSDLENSRVYASRSASTQTLDSVSLEEPEVTPAEPVQEDEGKDKAEAKTVESTGSESLETQKQDSETVEPVEHLASESNSISKEATQLEPDSSGPSKESNRIDDLVEEPLDPVNPQESEPSTASETVAKPSEEVIDDPESAPESVSEPLPTSAQAASEKSEEPLEEPLKEVSLDADETPEPTPEADAEGAEEAQAEPEDGPASASTPAAGPKKKNKKSKKKKN